MNFKLNLNLRLAQIFQFVVSLVFLTAVLFYFGVILLFPLAVLVYAIKIVSFTGTIASVVIGVAAVAYLGREVSKMPDLLNALLGVGGDLIAFGFEQSQRFEPIINSARENKA